MHDIWTNARTNRQTLYYLTLHVFKLNIKYFNFRIYFYESFYNLTELEYRQIIFRINSLLIKTNP